MYRLVVLASIAAAISGSASADVVTIVLPPTIGSHAVHATVVPTSFHFSMDMDIHPLSRGGGTGKVRFNELTWTQSGTSNLAYLGSTLATGASFPLALNLTSQVPGKPPASHPYFILNSPGPTHIENLQVGSSNGLPTVSVSALPTAVTLAYADAQGNVTGAGWDTGSNGKISPSQQPLGSGPSLPAASAPKAGIYLRLAGITPSDNIKGTSRVAGYENWIELSSAQIDLDSVIDNGTHSVTITSALTAANLSMFQDLVTGRPLKQATLEFFVPGTNDSSQWAFNTVYFSNMTIDEANGGPIDFTETLLFGGYSEADFSTGSLEGYSQDYIHNTTGGLSLAENVDGFGNGQFSISPRTSALAAVPEPSSWALMLLGFGSLGLALRRRPARAKA